jgi:predicted RNA-binding protein YlxR (DUF448 family)
LGTPHVPERTCVACRGKAPKAELLRVVRGSDGVVRVDPTGSAPGRGAYVHRDLACVDAALRRGAIARALRTRLDEGGAATLRADIEGELGS